MAARRLRIRGLVQGVGFRYATHREATRIGVRGWVRNCADGSVEVVAIGEDAQLDALDAWCRRGPPGARVDSLTSTLLRDDELARVQPRAGDDFRQAESVRT